MVSFRFAQLCAPALFLLSVGCGAQRNENVAPVFAGVFELAPAGVEPEAWSQVLDATSLCQSWADAAKRRQREKESQRSTATTLSTISGLLAIGAGTATGIVAGAQEDSEDAVDVSTIGGITSSVFGLGASIAGIMAGVKGSAATEANQVSVNLERVVANRTLAFIGASEARDIERLASDIASECAREARRLDGLEALPLGP
ncbi:MAG: hypothetical protein AAF658_19775, partial [Myxococcota bacterium]